MHTTPSNPQTDQEARIRQHGDALLQAAEAFEPHNPVSHWLQSLLSRLHQNPDFRIRALRFVDLLPALQDDAEVVRLFDEYFSDAQEFPLPRLGRLAIRSGRLLGPHQLAAAIRKAIGLLSRQFMAGREPTTIRENLSGLQRQGRLVSLDLLGELTLSHREADDYLNGYLQLLDVLSVQPDQSLQLSLKPSSLLPRLLPERVTANTEVMVQRLRPLLLKARRQGVAVTLDMEDSERRPVILALFERLLFDPEFCDWDGLGIALQAYLRQGGEDLEQLIELAGRRQMPFAIRLVRGAYWDQELVKARQNGWPIPVWEQQAETDRHYEACLQRLLAAAPGVYPAIASHNLRSLALGMAEVERLGLATEQFEFQMLYGMSTSYQQALVKLGYRLRTYLPFGEPIPGMAYLVRRLLENASSQSMARWQVTSEDAASCFAPPKVETRLPAERPEAGFQNTPLRSWLKPDECQAFQHAIDQVRGQLGHHYPLLIDGEWRDTAACIESFNPADRAQLVGTTACASQEDADRAIRAAEAAFPSWRERPAESRAKLLRKSADLLAQRRDEFAAWQILEAGKGWREADADVCEAIDFLRFYADEAERLAAGASVELPGEHNRHFYQPRGVGVVIPPWNFPLAIVTGMLSATLVTGNCAILKPASDTPVIAARLVDLMQQAGFPAGVMNFLPGPGEVVGDYLVRHPAVHLIAFTGSQAVGQGILRLAAEPRPGQRHIKRVIAELGGKNAIIVDQSADPDEAIDGILKSAFGFQGQKCSACSRVILVGDQYAHFSRRLCEAAESLIMADPTDSACDIGPVINAAAESRIQQAIKQGRQAGRSLYRMESRGFESGHYVGPTLFGEVDPNSPLAQEEIFGPVLALLPAQDLDQALALANSTRYALTGGVYSRSPANLERAAREFRVGNLYLNRGITGALVSRQPFGGFAMSGIGSKAGGRDYLLQFMEPRCITENTLRRGVAPLSEAP
jgi:RHH-type proline utilization regulon transcriptional repressor/proline dehydrogenase/delta 1-pyrroline-5-carboxylate dehydrogenase